MKTPFGKRAFDITLSAFGMLLTLPLSLVAAVAIKVDDWGPIVFSQERVGRNGKLFRILKFRTMRVTAPGEGPAITVSGDRRVTRVGGHLRAWKIDELPQLWNVLRGDMSLVGPRPEVPEYVARYSGEQREVLTLVPGITDPASIAYRNESELLAKAEDPQAVYFDEILPDKLQRSLAYARTATLRSDVKILFQTLLSL